MDGDAPDSSEPDSIENPSPPDESVSPSEPDSFQNPSIPDEDHGEEGGGIAPPQAEQGSDQPVPKSLYARTSLTTESFIQYAWDNLSPKAHGGIYLEIHHSDEEPVGIVLPHIWVVDRQAVEEMISGYSFEETYPFEKVEVQLQPTDCSMADLWEAEADLNKLEVSSMEHFGTMMDESANLIYVFVPNLDGNTDMTEVNDYISASRIGKHIELVEVDYLHQDV